jgi:zinc protease
MAPTRLSPRVRGMGYQRIIALDSTTYELRSTGSDVERSLEELQRASADFRVDWPPRQFTSQLQVMVAEDQQPSSELAHACTQAVFGGHPYGYRARPQEVRAATGTQVYKWINQVLRPENGALVMVGDFDPRKAVAKAREQFSSLRASDKKRRQVAPPPALARAAARGGDRLQIRHQAARTQVQTHFECVLPSVTAESAPVGTLFMHMLRDRVQQVLREKLGATYWVHGRVDYPRGGTALLRLESELGYDQLASALGVFRAYLEQPDDGTLDTIFLERARAAIARGYNLELSTTAAIARSVFLFWNRGWPMEDIDRFRERVLEARLADVRAVSQHCRDNWVIGMLGDQQRIQAAWAQAGG